MNNYVTKEQAIYNIAIRLFENAGKINHGSVSASLIVHEGKIVTVFHEVKETIRKREEVQNEYPK